ncbi:methyltransferase domain-containing protein [Nemania sp. FL0031]|nr:methyltransferase domain-containing protein [Nemania sp. FL0031]
MASTVESEPSRTTRVYTPFVLSTLYELGVLGLNFGLIWRCSVPRVLLPFFIDNLSSHHLDCGVGTGYFPANALARLHQDQRSAAMITLVDLNPNCLRSASNAIASAAPETKVNSVVADVKCALPRALHGSKFGSISMFNLFHCLPGGRDKLDVIARYKALLADDGVLMGCTVLGLQHANGWFTRLYLGLYNQIGIFNNLEDTEDDFARFLRSEFMEVELQLVGMVLLFKVAKPRH